MQVQVASSPGSTSRDNEDWLRADESLVVVLDGATARTDTGCSHGVAWYTDRLGTEIAADARDLSMALPDVLAGAISKVAAMHELQCDLAHPGTPSAAVGIVRFAAARLEYLVLGDVSVVLDNGQQITVITDNRVSKTAPAERAEADRHPIGSAAKAAALLRMKHAELAARNQPGGYWIAATDPTVVTHALTGAASAAGVARLAVFSDGAARCVTLGLLDWASALDLLSQNGPASLITRVRQAEASDPDARRWPRNKKSDDATIVYIDRT